MTPRQQAPRQAQKPLDLKNFISSDVDIPENTRYHDNRQPVASYKPHEMYVSQPIIIPPNIKVSQQPFNSMQQQTVSQPSLSHSMSHLPLLPQSNSNIAYSNVNMSQSRYPNYQNSPNVDGHTGPTLQIPNNFMYMPSHVPNLNNSYVADPREKINRSFTTGVHHNYQPMSHKVSSPDILASFSNTMTMLPRYDQY